MLLCYELSVSSETKKISSKIKHCQPPKTKTVFDVTHKKIVIFILINFYAFICYIWTKIVKIGFLHNGNLVIPKYVTPMINLHKKRKIVLHIQKTPPFYKLLKSLFIQ